MNRRAVLQRLGVGVSIFAAGCNSLQDNTLTGQGSDSNPTESSTAGPRTSGSTTDEETEASDAVATETIATGHIEYATGVADVVTYVTGGGSKRVVHGETEGPAFDRVVSNFFSVSGGIAYAGARKGSETYEYAIISGGDEQYRNEASMSAVDVAADAHGELWDVRDGRPIWSEATDQKYPSAFYIGEDRTAPAFDGIDRVQVIGDEIAFFSLTYDAEGYGRWRHDSLVQGGRTVQNLSYDATGVRGVSGLTGIDGEPALVLDKGNGEYIQYDGQQYGTEYTAAGDGEIVWMGERGGRLTFIAQVARDKIQSQERSKEFALWHAGSEIARHESIGALENSGQQVAMTDDGLAYSFIDTDESGVKIDESVVDSGVSASWVRSIDGTLAYTKSTENGDGMVIVYGGQRTTPQPGLKNVFEVGDDLAYLAQTEVDSPRANAVFREA
jgi:hypothetical protein